MNVFFSGTDTEELTDNAPNYNYYLSLIVNNKGEYCARVAFIGELEGRSISFKTRSGDYKQITTEKSFCTFYHEMDIEVEKDETVDEFFLKQYDKVIESKKVVYTPNSTWNHNTNTWDLGYGKQKELDFNTKIENSYKGRPSTFETEVDIHSIWLLKYILTDTERHLALTTLLGRAKVNTPKGIKENKEFLSQRFEKAHVYFKEFKKDHVDFDDEVTLEEMWLRMELLLEENMFSVYPLSQYIIEELSNWTWE